MLEALSCQLHSGVPWEDLYADDLVIIAESLEECVRRGLTWQEAIEEKGLRVNAGRTKVMSCGTGLDLLQSLGEFQGTICCTGVGSNSIFYNGCAKNAVGSRAWQRTLVTDVHDARELHAPWTADHRRKLECWGFTKRQPLWVILCCLPEKVRQDVEEIVEEMKARNREERGTGISVECPGDIRYTTPSHHPTTPTTEGSPSWTWQAGGGSFLLLPRRHALRSGWLWTFNHNGCENHLDEV